MNRLKDNDYCRQICVVYPPDLALIIVTYLLDKRMVYKNSWKHDCRSEIGQMFVVDNLIVICDCCCTTYDVNGHIVKNNLSMPYPLCYIGNNENIYMINMGCIIVCQRWEEKTNVVKHDIKLPWGATVMKNHLYVVDNIDCDVCVYGADGKYVRKWKIKNAEFPTRINNYDDMLFVLDERKIIRYDEKGEEKGTIMFRKHVDDFTVCDEKIYICAGNSVNVYDMIGKFIERIQINRPRYIATLHNNIVVSTYNDDVIVYSVQY